MDRRTAGLRGGVVVLGLTATLATAGSALAATGEESPGPPTATTSAPAARHQTEPRAHRAAPARPQSPAAALRASDQSPPAAARVAGARSRGPSAPARRVARGGDTAVRSTIPAAATALSDTTLSDTTFTPAATAQTVDPITALFNNSTPRLQPSRVGQAPGGVVTGTLGVIDPDSVPVGVAVIRGPAHGTVTVAGGQYTYTADPAHPQAHSGFIDSFAVTASDADSGFHIHGLAGLLNMLTFGLLGESGHRRTATVTVNVAAFNNAPTGTVRADPAVPGTGVVTGQVLGRDPNGDTLSYSGSTTTKKASVIVSPTGDFTYTPTAEALTAAAAPTATEADRRDEFTVTVEDGYGAVVAVAVAVNLGQGARAPQLSTFCGCTLMPADTVFHADVSMLPVLPKSAVWTNLLGGTLHTSWGRTPWQGSSGGMPVNVVGPDHPTETVIFNRGYSTSGPSIDDRPYAIPDRPLVEGMPDVPAWDRHLLVFQEGTCISQELYNVANGVELPAAGVLDALGNAAYAALWGSSWIAEAGVHVDMSSGLYPAQGWANASHLPYLPLILRPDDLERGAIDHMLGMSIAKDRGTGYTWPARFGDGTGTNPDGVPMGTVLRLSADFDLTGYQPGTQVVLRALQQHGAVVYDSFAAGRDGAGLLVMSNGWTGTGHFAVQDELNTIPLSAFEAVDVLGLAVDPTLGWMIRT